MADTIISNIPGTNDDASSGWIVALVIIFAIIIGSTVLYQRGFFATETGSTTNINVTVPDPVKPVTPVADPVKPITTPTTQVTE
ncbi:hypothetical protein IPH92_01855 [Candidatus Kaiserbacteria bacterium]|nr:MAG: hypothetical protein IPH92_01855 [Candidatus Kaiserbacteria bacterium]